MTDAARGIALGMAASGVVWSAIIAVAAQGPAATLGAIATVSVVAIGGGAGGTRWWADRQAAQTWTPDDREVEP